MAAIIFYTDIVETQRDEGETVYEAVSWTLMRPWNAGLEERIRTNYDTWLSLAQKESYAEAAVEARVKRDRLLAETDALMAFDRLGLSVPSGTSFTAWLSFFRKLGEALLGNAAVYRQALRDLPDQEGFPFDIDWPDLV